MYVGLKLVKRMLRKIGVRRVYRFTRWRLGEVVYFVMRVKRYLNSRSRRSGESAKDEGSGFPNRRLFLVLATARSGSTLLMERLSSRWSEIRSDGEIFNPGHRRYRPFDRVLDETLFRPSDHSLVGAKILSGHVSDAELRELLSLDDLKIILLRRNNVIRQFVSSAIARRDKVWVLTSASQRPDVARRRVHVDLDELLDYQRRNDAAYQRYEELCRGLPVLRSTYEDMMQDMDAELLKIGTFLGAGTPDRNEPPGLIRQNPEPLKDLILNFDELREKLNEGGHTELVAYLDS